MDALRTGLHVLLPALLAALAARGTGFLVLRPLVRAGGEDAVPGAEAWRLAVGAVVLPPVLMLGWWAGIGPGWTAGLLVPVGVFGAASDWRRRRADGRNTWRADGGASWLLIALLATVPLAFHRPWDYDVGVYHLAVPLAWLEAGAMEPIPGNVYSHLPLGAEMWFGAVLAWSRALGLDPLQGAVAAQVWNAVLAGLAPAVLCASVSHVLRDGAGGKSRLPGAGMAAGLALLAGPGLLLTAHRAYSEPLVTAGVCVALALVVGPRPESGRRVRALAAGAVLGGVVGAKLSAWTVALPLVAAAVLATEDGPRAGLRRMGWTALGAAVVFLPWSLRSLAWTGDPAYPFLTVWTGAAGPGVDSWDAVRRLRWTQAHGPGRSGLDAVAHAWRALTGWASAGGGTVVWTGPLLVLGIPFAALLGRGRRRAAATVGLCAAAALVLWLVFTHQAERFLVPAHPLAAFLSGLGAAAAGAWLAERGGARLRALAAGAGVLVAVVLALGTVLVLHATIRPAAPGRDLALRPDPLGRDDTAPARALGALGSPGAWAGVGSSTGASDAPRVLLVGGGNTFNLRALSDGVHVVAATGFDPFPLEPHLARAAAGATGPAAGEGREDAPAGALADALLEDGVTHLLVDWMHVARLQETRAVRTADRTHPGLSDRLPADLVARLTAAGRAEHLGAWGAPGWVVGAPRTGPHRPRRLRWLPDPDEPRAAPPGRPPWPEAARARRWELVRILPG